MAKADLDPDLIANYEALRESRGWDYATLAAHFEQNASAGDLAAWARSKATPDPKAVPAGRKQAAPAETA